MIQTKSLEKKFGKGDLELTALKDINLTINEKEFVAVIGPSGAGKSTLLYHLSLLDQPTTGEIIVDGINTSSLSESEKTAIRLNKFGYVFQDYALLPELSTIDNVALPMLMQGMSKKNTRQKAVDALIQVGLENKIKNLPSQLSGGQQQRVSIARAIAHNPHILFADEPTANLDSSNAAHVMEVFQNLHKAGQTIIMVTHEPEYAKKASRILSLKDGVVISDTLTK